MKTSVIRQRVADFLQRHAPFDALQPQDLLDLAGSGKVKFHESEEYLFRQGDPKQPFLWTIQQGRVELLEETPSGERLRDVLGEGDLLGLDRFAGDGRCLHSARTATDVILYGVAASLFESTLLRYPEVQRFLAARFSVSNTLGFSRTSWLDAAPPPLSFLRARLSAQPSSASSEDTARALAASRNGVVALLDDLGRPTGAVTVRGTVGASLPAINSSYRTRDAVRKLLHTHSDILAITADGSCATPLQAVLTARDLALFCHHDPAALLHAIRHASSAAEIAPLLQLATRLMRDAVAQPHDIDDACIIGSEVIAALATACTRLAAEDLHAAGIDAATVAYCWVIFGASARGDLLEPELPTLAVIYDDASAAHQPEHSAYFAALAGETAARFHAFGLPGVGLEWPEGARPSMPLSEWKRLYTETIRNPFGHDLFARRSFFDLRPLAGDTAIARHLQDHILHELSHCETALAMLANDTLGNVPPLTFFRGVVLHLDGAEHDSFDIAEAVIAPLSNAARVFALSKRRLEPCNTLQRLETALLDFPEGVGVLRQAADAFRIGLYYQTLAGGARIDSASLAKFDQLLLKSAFSSIESFLEFTFATFFPAL